MIDEADIDPDFSGITETKTIYTDLLSGEKLLYTHNSWYKEGRLHREDGPAIIGDGGRLEWWINGLKLTEEQYANFLDKKNLNEKLHTNLVPKHHKKKNMI